jgi:hypothetical protein
VIYIGFISKKRFKNKAQHLLYKVPDELSPIVTKLKMIFGPGITRYIFIIFLVALTLFIYLFFFWSDQFLV